MKNDSVFFLQLADDPKWRREISWAFNKSGSLLLSDSQDPDRQAELRSALGDFSNALCLRHLLSDEDNTTYSRDIAFTYEHVAVVDKMLSDRQEQEKNLIASLRIREKLVADDRVDSRYAEDLASTYQELGEFYALASPSTPASDEFSAAFYEAELTELERASDLQDDEVAKSKRTPDIVARDRAKVETAKANVEKALATVRTEGTFMTQKEGWWRPRVDDVERKAPTPEVLDASACILEVTRAARGAVSTAIAAAER